MKRRDVLGLAAGAAGGLSGCASLTPTTDASDLYVDASVGKNLNPGTPEEPMASIPVAVNQASPGDTVHVRPGVYDDPLVPQHGGEPGAPITITGPPDAVLRSSPRTYNVVLLRHSHIHIRGLTIDGLEVPSKPHEVGSYSRAQLVQARPPEETDEYLADLVVAPHRIGNTQKSLVSLERTRDSVVGPFTVIGPAGAKYLYDDRPGHNGEIVYLGTATDNLGSDWHPWETLDETRNVRVHHIDNSAGHPHAELVDVKPGARNVTIEYCTDVGGAQYLLEGHSETSESAIHLCGSDCTVRWNRVLDSQGQAVHIGCWGVAHPERYEENKGRALPAGVEDTGKNNAVYGNVLHGAGGLALQFPIEDDEFVEGLGPDAQAVICGNDVDGQTMGNPEKPCGDDVPAGTGIGHTGGDGPST